MAIVRWTPARELIRLSDQMDRLMEDVWGQNWSRRTGWENGAVAAFPMDVYQTDKEYVVKATLPGVKADDLDVSIVGETLTIKATVQGDRNVKDEEWLLKESRYTNFSRAITLPSEVQADKVDAALDSGVLTLRIPRSEAILPRSIKVKATR